MRRSTLLTIFAVVFVDLLGFGIVIPILPYYAQSYGASPAQLGWLMASYSIMQFLFAPVWGRLSDRIGRRPVLLTSIFGTALSMAGLGFAPSLLWLFVGRIFAGICGANISTAYAYIADVTDSSNRAAGMGLIGAAFGLGFIFGPATGGILSRYGYSTPMFAAAVLALVNLTFAFWTLKEPPLTEEKRHANRDRRFDSSTYRAALQSPRSRLGITTFFFFGIAVTQMETMFAVFMWEHYQLNAEQAGYMLALVGLVMVSMQGGLTGKLARRFGEYRLILGALILCCLGLAGFGLARTLPLSTAAMIALAIGRGVLHPCLSSMTSLGAPPERQGATLGVFHSAASLARALGPPLAGYAYGFFGSRSPFIGGAAILMLTFVYARIAGARIQAA